MNPRAAVCAVALVMTAACDPFLPMCQGLVIDACQKAQELSHHMGVQLGDVTTAGNPTPGQAGAMGAAGRMSLGLRSNLTQVDNPRFGTAPVRADGFVGGTAYAGSHSTMAAFSGDVVLGALRGFRIDKTRVGAVDLLGSVTFTPGHDGGSLRSSGGGLGMSLGLRLGLLAETSSLPAVSVTAMVRDLPKFDVTSQPMPTTMAGHTVVIALHDLEVGAAGTRIDISKQLGRVSVSAGFGEDHYDIDSEYEVRATSPELGGGTSHTWSSMSRRSIVAGVSIPLGAATVGAEVGRLFGGGSSEMMNQFGGRPANAARNYLTFGVRIPAGRKSSRD